MKHLMLAMLGASIVLAAAAGASADELGKSQAGFVYAKQFCSM